MCLASGNEKEASCKCDWEVSAPAIVVVVLTRAPNGDHSPGVPSLTTTHPTYPVRSGSLLNTTSPTWCSPETGGVREALNLCALVPLPIEKPLGNRICAAPPSALLVENESTVPLPNSP